MRLLAQHPDIIVHGVYPYEVNTLRYWLHALVVLAAPADPTHSAHPDSFSVERYWVGHNPYHATPMTEIASLRHWFGHDYAEELAAFCQRSIAAYYDHVALSQQQTNSLYFAEKVRVDLIPTLTWELYPQAREILYVRDLRDVLCSVQAFNARRGFLSFGYQYVQSHLDYVKLLRAQGLKLVEAVKCRREIAHVLRYEDLILNPEDSLKHILVYLGLEASANVVQKMISRASLDTPEMAYHRTSMDVKRSIGRWKYDLSDELKTWCHEYLDDVLLDLGYCP